MEISKEQYNSIIKILDLSIKYLEREGNMQVYDKLRQEIFMEISILNLDFPRKI